MSQVRLDPSTSELLPVTRDVLQTFASRRALLQTIRGFALGLIALIGVMTVLALIDHFVRPSTFARVFLSLVGYVVAGLVAYRGGIASALQREPTEAARSLEATGPQFREQLVSAVELSEASRANGSAEFRHRLQTNVANQVAGIEIRRVLPWSLIRRALEVSGALLLTLTALGMIPSLELPRRLGRVFLPVAPIQRASLTKIELMHPNPPTAMVAEGDLVAVTAAIRRLGNSDVWLETRDANGSQRQRMVRRSLDATFAEPGDESNGDSDENSPKTPDDVQVVSVNLAVDDAPVDYRVLAGDAETLWYTLTPRKRPSVISFTKQYRFPAYAGLPDQVVTETHGDLAAFTGTEVQLEVQFDQPVRDAKIQFATRGDGLPLSPSPAGENRFQIDVPISVAGNYRIDAFASETNLNNPFSPRYTIDPILDLPPTAAWDESVAVKQIASPAAILSLSGKVADDLPIDFFIQQVLRAGGGVSEQKINLSKASVSADVQMDWDLAQLDVGSADEDALKSGGRLKTRLIAVDRAGRRGASNWIDIYIADGTFDPDRHAKLNAQLQLTRDLSKWFEDLRQLTEELQTFTKAALNKSTPKPFALDVELTQRIAELQQRWTTISGMNEGVGPNDESESTSPRTLRGFLTTSPDTIESDQWSRLDSATNFILDEVAFAIEQWQALDQSLPRETDFDQRRRLGSQYANSLNQSKQLAEKARHFVRWKLAVELAVGLSNDFQSVQSLAEALGSEDANIPTKRLPGQSDLLKEQLRQVSDLATGMETALPDEMRRHHEQIHRFVDDKSRRISDLEDALKASQDGDAERPFREGMRQIATEVAALRVHGILHGNAFNQIASAIKEFSAEPLGWAGGATELNRIGRQWQEQQKKTQSIAERGDSDNLAQSRAIEAFLNRQFESRKNAVLNRLAQTESRQQMRTDSRVSSLADLDLARRVVEQVTKDGYAGTEVLSASQTPARNASAFFDEINRAILTLDAGNQTHLFADQYQFIADRERYPVGIADRSVRQGLRLEHVQTASDLPLTQLRHGGVDADLIDQLHRTRWDDNYNQARDWITRRRWSGDPLVSAAAPIESIVIRFQTSWDAIDPVMNKARKFLRGLLPSLGERARQAAAEADQQSETIQEEQSKAPDTPKLVTEQATNRFEELQEQVNEVAKELTNRANNEDYANEESLQDARDADAAIAAINQTMQETAKNLQQDQPEQASQSLQEVAQTLRNVADHFEAIDAGEDVSQSRERLREAAAQENAADSIQDAIDAAMKSAESAASANERTPEELIEQLEKRLPVDDAMSESLDDIANQTAKAAEQTIRQVAEEEQSMRRSLERSDKKFAEQKRMARDQLRSLADRANAVRDHLLVMAEQASGWAKEPATQQQVRDARKQLDEAIREAQQVQNDNALLSEIQNANEALRDATADVAKQTETIADTAKATEDKPVHNNTRERDKTARQLESVQRNLQNRYLQSLQRETQAWRRSVDEAGRRVQQAQNQGRGAKRDLDRAKEQLEKNEGEEWAQRELQQTEQRLKETQRAEQAAKETRRVSTQAEQESKERYKEAQQKSVANLEAENPAAELLRRATEQASEELRELADALLRNENRLDLEESLAVSPRDAEQLANKQQQLQNSVTQASEELRRAARHEQRLGQNESAAGLDQAADALEQVNQNAMNEAQESIRGEQARQAARSLGEAAEQLRQSADALAGQAASQNPSGESSSSGQPGSQPSRSERLARTLDELDRAVNSSPQTEQASETEQANGQNPTSNQPSQASSTLNDAAQQAIRNLARQRQQQLQQLADAGQPEPSSDPSQPNSQTSMISGDTQGGDLASGLIDASDWAIVDGDWGDLRQKQTNEVVQDRKVRVPMSYRQAVQAYFEAVSAEASSSSNAARRSKRKQNTGE